MKKENKVRITGNLYNNNPVRNVGFVSAQQIYNDLDIQEIDEANDKRTNIINSTDEFLPLDLFLWRCEQYKKYRNVIDISQSKLYVQYRSYLAESKRIPGISFKDWLFDFVMNGEMDKEYKEEKKNEYY